MSWDVWLIRTKTNTEEFREIKENDCIPISKEELIDAWKTIAKKVNVSVKDVESHYPHMRGENWSIEALFFEEVDKDITLEIRGSECPVEVLHIMANLLRARAFDTSTGHFLDGFEINGFNEWKAINQKAYDVITKDK